MANFIGTVVQGSKMGVTSPKPTNAYEEVQYKEQEAMLKGYENKEYVFYFNPKQDAIYQKKYRKLIDLAISNLPEYILKEIWGEANPETKEQQREYLAQSLKAELGYTKPCLQIISGRKTMGHQFISTATFTNEEFAVYYAKFRDLLFEYCQQHYVIKVNKVAQIFEPMNDLQMFEAFSCLYLGFPLQEIEKVEKALGEIDANFAVSYLRFCKLEECALTAEQFNNTKK